MKTTRFLWLWVDYTEVYINNLKSKTKRVKVFPNNYFPDQSSRIFIEIKLFSGLKYIKIRMSAIQIKISRNIKKQENNKKIQSIKTGTDI